MLYDRTKYGPSCGEALDYAQNRKMPPSRSCEWLLDSFAAGTCGFPISSGIYCGWHNTEWQSLIDKTNRGEIVKHPRELRKGKWE